MNLDGRKPDNVPQDQWDRMKEVFNEIYEDDNMERLTEKHYDGKGYFMKCSGACANDDEMCGGCPQLDKIIDRLAAYEDTGLTPGEVNKLDSQRKAMAALADSYKAEIPCWIPVSERLPEAGIEVLAMLQVNKFDGHDAHNVTTAVLIPSESWLVADYQEGIMAETSGTDCEDCCYWITHWMPLPMPPEEE